MFKLDLDPLAPRLLQNREAHIYYLKHTQEQADIHLGIVEQAKAKQPVDNVLDLACKHATRIQESLVYVQDTCPNAIKLSEKKVDITPMNKVIQIVLWYLDCGCSKHMTGNRSQFMNFVSKFLGTVRFENDQVAKIIGYGDYQLGNVIVSRVYYVEGLRHNVFSIGQFCDADLGVSFRKNTCFIQNLEVPVAAAPRAVDITELPVSTSIDLDAPSTIIPSTQEQEHSPIISQGFEESPKTPHFHDDPFHESLHEDSTSHGSPSNVRPSHTLFEHLSRWTKDHPIVNVIGDPSRSVSTRKQLETDAMWCYFDAFLTSVEPKNFKQAMTEPSWIDEM
ncbi:hypothetical protein Tco_0665529 [Tanacetum coccineum]